MVASRVKEYLFQTMAGRLNCSREMRIKNGAQRQPPRKEKWHNCTSKYFALLLLTLLSTLQGLSGKSGETLKGFTGLRTLDRSWIGSKVRTWNRVHARRKTGGKKAGVEGERKRERKRGRERERKRKIKSSRGSN